MQVLEATDGGTLHYLLDLAYNLPLRQFDIHLVVSTERNPAFVDEIERLRSAGIEVSVVPMVRKIRPARDWACMIAIRDLIRSWRPDVIHSHSSKAGFLARFAARSFPCANLYTPHCFAFTMSVGPLRQALYLQLERYAGTLTNMLVLLCESERQTALDASIVPWEKITVVPTGIRPEDYQCAEDRDEIRRELGVGGFDLVLGVVGALVVQKGHTYLLSAMKRMLPDINVAAIFAGRGELEAQLRGQARQLGIADRVFFLGHRADTARLYAAMDLFVLPSLWEGLPYVLMEAMVAGTPAVATDIPGNRDLIKEDYAGWQAQPRNSASLAATIVDAAASPDECRRRAERAEEMIRRHHGLDAMITRYVRLYSDMAVSVGD